MSVCSGAASLHTDGADNSRARNNLEKREVHSPAKDETQACSSSSFLNFYAPNLKFIGYQFQNYDSLRQGRLDWFLLAR